MAKKSPDAVKTMYPQIVSECKKRFKSDGANEVWLLLQDLQLLQGVQDEKDVDDAVWAIQVTSNALQSQKTRNGAEVAISLVRGLPAKEHEAWYRRVDKDGVLDSILASHPRKQVVIQDPMRAARNAVAIGVIVEHLLMRWVSMLPWQQKFMYREVTDSGGRGDILREAQHIIGVMSPDSFSFLFAKELIRCGNARLALKVIYETPKAQLAATTQYGDPMEKHSYYELYTHLQVHGGQEDARALLEHFVESEAYSDESFQFFLRNEDMRHVLAFVVDFVSTMRQKHPTEASQNFGEILNGADSDAENAPLRNSKKSSSCLPFLGGSSNRPSNKKPGGSPAKTKGGAGAAASGIHLKVGGLPHVLLKELLGQYEAQDPTGRDYFMHKREVLEGIEVVLLLSESSTALRFVERLSDEYLKYLRIVLKDWTRLHLLRVMEMNREKYQAESQTVSHLVKGDSLWSFVPSSQRPSYFKSDDRNSEDLALVIWTFFELSMFLDSSIIQRLLSYAQLKRPPLHILDTYLPQQCVLYDVMVAQVAKRLTKLLQQEVKLLMRSSGFYDAGMQAFLQSNATEHPRAVFGNTFVKLIQACARLVNFKGGHMDPKSLESCMAGISTSCQGNGPCLNLVTSLVDATLSKDDMSFLPDGAKDVLTEASSFNVAGLASCARRLREACDSVRNNSVQLTFRTVVSAFMETPPRGWVPLFNSLETVLFFLRFIEKEDLPLAYDQFLKENHGVFEEDPDMRGLLDEARKFYTKPFINAKTDIANLPEMDVRQRLSKALAKVEGNEDNQRAFTAKDWNIVVDIAACAAQSMKEKYNVPMLPHHTQMITLLMFACQMCKGTEGQPMPRTILARVGTGEGKSWIIGMLAAFVAKKGLKAHVVIDNDTLLERDYSTMAPLFKKLKLTSEKRKLDKDAQIVYCSAMDIECHIMKLMQEGASSVKFHRHVMVVDEVDSLIVDDNVYTSYVEEYKEASDICGWWIAKGRNESPYNHTSWKRRVMEQLEIAEADMKSKKEGKHYTVDKYAGTVWALDERTALLKRSAWYLWLELKRKQMFRDYQIHYMTKRHVISKKSCFSAYPYIFGLTGSLGTEAEMAYTKKHFNSSHFYVPSFLDTCVGEARPRAKCVLTRCEEDAEQQLDWTSVTAKDHCSSVPILVVCRDPERVQKVVKRLQQVLGPPYNSSDRLGPGVIELLDTPGKEAEFQQLVEVATQPMETVGAGGKPGRTWRVTVTTAIGARGQDFHISDDIVDEKGGLLLIIEYVPDSEREWIQFLGRTARHDHPGQYAVVLNKQEYGPILVGKDVSTEGVAVRAILEEMNKSNAEHLDSIQENIDRGQAMHKFTGIFWGWAKRNEKDKELWRDKFGQWVDLCETFEDKAVTDIQEAFAELQVCTAGEIYGGDASGQEVYTGDLINGLRHGHGRCVFPDGRVYTGEFARGKMSGEGQMCWPTGEVYEGQYFEDRKSGQGKFSWPDGRSYNGEWFRGKQHGRGTYTDATGKNWTGEWRNGKKAVSKDGDDNNNKEPVSKDKHGGTVAVRQGGEDGPGATDANFKFNAPTRDGRNEPVIAPSSAPVADKWAAYEDQGRNGLDPSLVIPSYDEGETTALTGNGGGDQWAGWMPQMPRGVGL